METRFGFTAWLGLRRRSWAWAIALASSVGFGLFLWFRESLEKQIDSRLAKIKAAGQPVTLPELDKYHGWVPAEQNAALHFMEAAYSLIPPESVSTNLTVLLRPNSAVNASPLPLELRLSLSQFISNN